ncbi:MAG: zf-HC2 domain-containing protein [Candidatus Zipacnadales bacterium]
MKPVIGIASCSTIEAEVEQCCRELGLPVQLYSNRPACLFGIAQDELAQMLAEATTNHKFVLVAMGLCCAPPEMGGVARISADRCAEMLLGRGTYSWHVERGFLPLPSPYFGKWLRPQETRSRVEQFLAGRPITDTLQGIVVVEEGHCKPDKRDVAVVERVIGRSPSHLYTGLGHLREILRTTARRAGIPLRNGAPCPIAQSMLGPGDDCLVMRGQADEPASESVTAVTEALAHNLKCYWLMGAASANKVAQALQQTAAHVTFLQAYELPAITQATHEPRLLVEWWVKRALEALTAGQSGICIIHGAGWAERAGLSDEYVLEYASRLAAACMNWPIFNLHDVVAPTHPLSTLDEYMRTHPLLWSDGRIHISRQFISAEDYLGNEQLLETLGQGQLTFKCSEAAPLISALADGELTSPASVAITRHAERCPLCSELLRRHREIKESLALLRTPPVENSVDALWEHIRGKLTKEQ